MTQILAMMKEFYVSDAVFTNGSDEIFENDFQNCVNDNTYLEGYVFCVDEKILGYETEEYTLRYLHPLGCRFLLNGR